MSRPKERLIPGKKPRIVRQGLFSIRSEVALTITAAKSKNLKNGASDGTCTHSLLVTKQELYY